MHEDNLVQFYFSSIYNNIPRKDDFKLQYEICINTEIEEWINNFDSFKDTGYEIILRSYPTLNALLTIGLLIDEKRPTTFELDYEVDVVKDGKLTSLKNYNTKVYFNFNRFYQIYEELVAYMNR